MAMPQQAKPTEISRSENPFRRVGDTFLTPRTKAMGKKPLNLK